MSSYYKPQPKPSYTITNAKQDIEHLGSRMNELDTTMRLLRDEVDQVIRDEWRALDLCKMALTRLNILEALFLEILKPEGQQYLTHKVMSALRKENAQKKEQANVPA